MSLEEQKDEGRLSRLEAIVEALATEVSDLKDIMVSKGKTDWSVLASWAAVIIAFISLMGSGYVRDLYELKSKVDRVQEYRLENERRYSRLEGRLEVLQERIQYHKENGK